MGGDVKGRRKYDRSIKNDVLEALFVDFYSMFLVQ